jgi:hypothetical protein
VFARWLFSLVARDLAVTPPLAQSLTRQGSGDVTGVQLTARIVGWRGLSGWLSYNLSRSRRQDSRAAQAARPTDGPSRPVRLEQQLPGPACREILAACFGEP